MTDLKYCPQCQVPLPADAPAGLCPRCLMRRGLETTMGPGKPRSVSPQAGEILGPYRIDHLLGSGGMGAVYAATHLESGRRVALKILNHRLESPEQRQRFLREGRLAASVNHPHIVYVFGSEEIDGTPAIAMELVPGGTLQDRVQSEGPLDIHEAVDVVLQIIDGLEAAETAGVLHRDVKPSNCFLDEEGRVKVGDFGLSISTMPRADTNLTQSGVFLGTPAFASPEQLRGDELDVRSDIYSVGVTLFYLLTGRAPFEAPQFVQLLAVVLERPAPSPATFRREIPRGLAVLVQRCLEKQSKRRFGSYAELRQALRPYGSEAPTPATFGYRVVAYGVDALVIAVLATILASLCAQDWSTWKAYSLALLSAEPNAERTLMGMGVCGVALYLIYFTACEGTRGITAGKALCGLRVIGGHREPPRLWQAFVRAGAFFAAELSPWWIGYAVVAAADAFTYDAATPWLTTTSIFATALLFVTARRTNGYAGVHELVSGTRVVRIPTHQLRPHAPIPDTPLPALSDTRKVGPYHILDEWESDGIPSLLLGYDTRLLRKVWIRPGGSGMPPVPGGSHRISRIGRLRWLNGLRSSESNWDAYEAPSGQSLLELTAESRPWNAVRFWLLDLAEELQASMEDGSLPAVLDFDRVWITGEGRAKLLDFPAPRLPARGMTPPSAPSPGNCEDSATIFLKRVAIAALEGQLLPAEESRTHDLNVPIPVSARDLINHLGRSPDNRLPVTELRALTQHPALVSPRKRAGVLALWLAGPCLLASILTMFFLAEKRTLREYPDIGVLAGYLDYYHSLDVNDGRRGAIETVIAARYQALIEDPDFAATCDVDDILTDVDGRRTLAGFLAAHPHPTAEQILVAEEQLAPYRWEIAYRTAATDEFYSIPVLVFFLSAWLALLLGCTIIPSILSVLFLGDSLLLRSLSISVVTRNGKTASRARLLWRYAVFWSIVVSLFALMIALVAADRVSVASIVLLIWTLGTLATERGLPDRLAGTHLVPR